MSANDSLNLILQVLKEVRGHFVVEDEAGEEYIVISRQHFDTRLKGASEEQLQLLGQSTRSEGFGSLRTADDVLEKINRDLALYHLQREEEDEVNPGQIETEEETSGLLPLPPTEGKKVRFEPLRGDLAPELQD